MFYNNGMVKNKPIVNKIEVSRFYIERLCIIRRDNGNIYNSSRFNVSSINITSRGNSAASGNYTKSLGGYWVNGIYRASYNYNRLNVIDTQTGLAVNGCELNYINVTSSTTALAGKYYYKNISTWVKRNAQGVDTDYELVQHQLVEDTTVKGVYELDVVQNVYFNNMVNPTYKVYIDHNKWVLQKISNGEYITPFNVVEQDSINTFNNLVVCQGNLTVRNTIYEHARLHNYDIDGLYDRYSDVDYLNYVVSSSLNLHDNVILNKARRTNFKGADVDHITNYVGNYESNNGTWYEGNYTSGVLSGVGTKLNTQYVRDDGTAITDYIQGLVKTVNGSLISNNNQEYLYRDNMYKKVDNISDDFYNLPSNVIGGTAATGGVWYKSYDKFYSKQLFQQLNTYAEYSKLMLNNGNMPYWDVRDGRGVFYESGIILFESGYSETVTNFTNRVISFIKSLPTNLNGCEITFVFVSYGDSQVVNFAGSVNFENFYNGTVRIVGLSQNKTKIISNDYKKPVFVFNNVDKVYIDNIAFDYNVTLNKDVKFETNCGVLKFENINSVQILETELNHVYAPQKYSSSSIVTNCAIDLVNSNITIDSANIKRCHTAIRAKNNSKVTVNSIQLDRDDVNKQYDANGVEIPIQNNWHLYFKYIIDLKNNSLAYFDFDRYVKGSSKQFLWRETNNKATTSAVVIEDGSVLNHTHVGLRPVYDTSDNGSIITTVDSTDDRNDYVKSSSYPLNTFNDYRMMDLDFNNDAVIFNYNESTLENLHFYQSFDYKRSQLPIGSIIEWLSVNTYADNDRVWEDDLNMWPYGFYPCWEKYYPPVCKINSDGKNFIAIPINGHDVNDYFYNVPLAVKLAYLVNTVSGGNEDVNNKFKKNFLVIPNIKPTLVFSRNIGNVIHYVRKIKLIKYSEKVEYR